MPRAATQTESFPPLVEAVPEIADAVRRFIAARRAKHAYTGDIWADTPSGFHPDYNRLLSVFHAARMALDELILRGPHVWHMVDGMAWGKAKTRGRKYGGWDVVSRDPAKIRQPTPAR